jgi:hypothetical protein
MRFLVRGERVDIRHVNAVWGRLDTGRGGRDAAIGKTGKGNGGNPGSAPQFQTDLVSLGGGARSGAGLYSASSLFKMTGVVELISDEFGASGFARFLANP